MALIARTKQHFKESITTKIEATDLLAEPITRAAEAMIAAITSNHKILACGNGGSAGDSQHFAAELINRFEKERRALPAIALSTDTSTLTSIANDYCYENIFSRQVEALGQTGDCLLAISTSGNSANIIKAIHVAQEKNMRVIALTGGTGGEVRAKIAEGDIEICVPSSRTSRIQETHLLVIHCICDLIDHQLFD